MLEELVKILAQKFFRKMQEESLFIVFTSELHWPVDLASTLDLLTFVRCFLTQNLLLRR